MFNIITPLALTLLLNSAAFASQQTPFNLESPDWRGAQQDSQTRIVPRAQPAPGASDPMLEIPTAYLGCWQGEPRPDAWHQYSGPRIEGWVPSTVTLCLMRNASGVEVTYHKQALDEAVNRGRIVNTTSRTVAVGSVGDHIALKSWGSAQERAGIFGLPIGPAIEIKWIADSNLTLTPDQHTMLVEESMDQICSGTKRCRGGRFVSAVWHGAFHRVATP